MRSSQITVILNQAGNKKCEIRKISKDNRDYAYIKITSANGVPQLSFSVRDIKIMDKLPINIIAEFKKQDSESEYFVFDIKKNDGSIVSEILTNENGDILGKVVGGRDGVIPLDPPFLIDDIDSLRLSQNLLGLISQKWIKIKEISNE